MRSSSRRVRASSCRSRCVAASLIVLAACGDDTTAHRLAPARYVYDDGSEQIDRHALYDRTLQTLCEPTLFSDGALYCKPPTDNAFYTDDSCQHPIGRVLAGQSPKPFVASTFGLAGELSISRVYRTGAATQAPQQRWERRDNLCIGMPLDDGYDYYEVRPEVSDLARVELGMSDDYDTLLANHLTGDGVNVPWNIVDARYGDCDVVSRPTGTRTFCRPRAAEPIVYFEDNQCSRPIIVGAANRLLAYTGDVDCPTYFQVGVDALTADLYQQASTGCVHVPTSGPTQGALVTTQQVMLPVLMRTRSGTGRIKPITLEPTTLSDDLVFDTGLGVDCRRDEQGRCVPARVAPVETWFTDASCSQPIDVAMVAAHCTFQDPRYAQKGDTYFDIGAVYGQQLYQLSTGDTCQIYNPPVPQVAHSLGAAVSDTAFARATLTIE